MSSLRLVRVCLGEFRFRLLWSGRAMFAWRESGYTFEQIDEQNPDALATILHLMGESAAAATRLCGGEPDKVPSVAELVDYLCSDLAMVAEIIQAKECMVAALRCGQDMEYTPPDGACVDLSTLELKKN